MSEKKVTIIVDGVEKELDLNDKEICEKYNIHVGDVPGDDHTSSTFSKVKHKVIAVTPLVCVLAYLSLGFLSDGAYWHPGWVVFLLIPIVPLIFSVFEKKGRAFVNLLVIILCTVAYLLLGFLSKGEYWHPGWLIFFLVPIISILIGSDN